MSNIDILNKTKSPFNDKEIIDLAKTFIKLNMNLEEFYKCINKTKDLKENLYLKPLYEMFSKKGTISKSSKYWKIIQSKEGYLDVPDEIKDRKLLFRIYLNAKGKDKLEIVKEYVKRCEENHKDYNFKYSVCDGRDDEIIILSDEDELSNNIEIVKEIVADKNLGNPPKLVGKYENNIGIGEEYIKAPIYSYTQIRLIMIEAAIQKFILDNSSEFKKYCNEEEKEIIDDYKKELAENLKYSNNDEIANFALKNNIDSNLLNVIYFVPNFKNSIKVYLQNCSENKLKELSEDYRVACETHEISRNGVFSKVFEKTSKMHNNSVDNIKDFEKSIIVKNNNEMER